MYSCYIYDYSSSSSPEPICCFSDVSVDSAVKLLQTSLQLKENAAGQFDFTMLPNNNAADNIKIMSTILEIYKDGDIFWRGRVISNKMDAYNRQSVSCEGALNFLSDTIQAPMHVTCGIAQWIHYLLDTNYTDPDDLSHSVHACHNQFYASSETYKRFNIAYFDPSIELAETVDWYANYETTLELLNNVLEAYSVKMEVTYENGITNVSFYKDYPSQYQSQQVLMFGRNLLTYSRNWSIDDLATVIIPKGKKFDNENRPLTPYTPADLDAVTTVASVNSGSIYVPASEDVIARYGQIFKTVEWNDIEDPANLLDLAQDYLTNFQFDKMTLELTAQDLSLLMSGNDREANELKVLGQVRCVSRMHGLDRYFPITEMKVDLNNPGKTEFVLGKEDNANLSAAAANVSNDLSRKIAENEVQQGVLISKAVEESAEYADELMHDFADVGHVFFVHDEDDPEQLTAIGISNKVNWSDNDAKLWMWNQGGLAWSEDGGATYSGIAITNDGKINANFITTGTMTAARIYGGTLQDAYGNITWNLETGLLQAREFTLETGAPYTPDSQTYLYLSNRTWDINSIYTLSPYSMESIKVGGYDSDQWRLVIGRLFGVTELGTLAANDARFGGTTDAIEHRVVYHSIVKEASTLGADYVHVVLGFQIMSNLYGDQVEPALNDDSTHYHIRWIYQYDLNVGEDVDANVMGSGWVALTIQKDYVNVTFDDERQVVWSTKNFTLNDMINADASHYRVEFKVEEGGFDRQYSNYGLDAAGWYIESVPNPEAYPLFFKQGYLRGGSNTLGDNGTFILSTRNSGEIFGVDHQGTLTIADETRSDWRMTIGNCFGVTEAGYVYSVNGFFQRATVTGSFSTQNIVSTVYTGAGRSITFDGSAAEASTVTKHRYINLKVTSFVELPTRYFRVTVKANIIQDTSTPGYELDSDIPVTFYLGYWGYSSVLPSDGWNTYDGDTHGWKTQNYTVGTYDEIGSGFYNMIGEVGYTLTIPKNLGTGTVTKTCDVYHPKGPAMFSAIMLSTHYKSSSQLARPMYKPPNVSLPDQGWSDRDDVYYHPGQDAAPAIRMNNPVVPGSDGQYILGGVGARWKQVYAQTGVINTSARIKKKDITALPESFDIFFDQLRSVSYRWKNDPDIRKHCGFILDEVGYALDAAGIDKDEFAGYVEFDHKDHLADGGLNYSEFIAINTDQIQKLKKRVSELETLVEELERTRNED